MSPERFRELLQAKGASAECPACGAEDWRGLDDVIDLPVRVPGASREQSHVRIPGFQALAPSCGRCGHVRLLDLRLFEGPLHEQSDTYGQPEPRQDEGPADTGRSEKKRPSRKSFTNIWGDPISRRGRRDR